MKKIVFFIVLIIATTAHAGHAGGNVNLYYNNYNGEGEVVLCLNAREEIFRLDFSLSAIQGLSVSSIRRHAWNNRLFVGLEIRKELFTGFSIVVQDKIYYYFSGKQINEVTASLNYNFHW